ncbi:LADA_0A08020g1_1 [Lachancea dasiensis]|uniref:LADA_0A08020g1_1 n=1 Tax=Lachancea dasiensis TaxID=1072105 RepID=A0A1G4IQ81_9SACH|nr:LADA_0A08020g1_1 [Lachancea dasiensis]
MTTNSSKKLSIEERLSLAARAKSRKKGKKLDSPSPLTVGLETNVDDEESNLKAGDGTSKETFGGNDDATGPVEGIEDIADILPSNYDKMTVLELLQALKPHLVREAKSERPHEKSQVQKEHSDSSLIKLIKEKDSIIGELRAEGESLSKLELRHTTTIKSLREKLNNTEFESQRCKKELDEGKQKLGALSSELKDLTSRFNKSIEISENLTKERNDARASHDKLKYGELATVQRELEMAQETNKSLELQKQRLRDQLETLNMKSTMKYEELSETSKGEISRLELSLEELRILLSKSPKNSDQLVSSTQNDLMTQIKELKARLEVSADEAAKMESALRRKLVDSERKYEELQESHHASDRQLAATLDENNHLRPRLHELEQKQKLLTEEIAALNKEVSTLTDNLDNARDDAKLWQEKFRISKGELESRLINPVSQSNATSEVASVTNENKEPFMGVQENLDKISKWELQNLQNMDSSYAEEAEVTSNKYPFDIDELLPGDGAESPMFLRKSSMASLDYASSQQQRNLTQSQQSTQLNAQMVGRLGGQIRRLETELSSLQASHDRLWKEKQEVNNTIFQLMEENEKATEVKGQLKESCERAKKLEEELEATTKLLKERTERVDELENDVDDLKEMMQMQVQQMVELQEQVR